VDHEQAWADALATEHAHQRELLATLRGELGTFAKECAAALTALDGYVSALGGVVTAIQTAQLVHTHADLAADVYARFAGDSTLPVGPASELLRKEPHRTDRELLQAIVSAAGSRAQVEQIVGPAPLAALAALAPLAKWKERGLRGVATDIAAAENSAVADAQALASSLKDAVDHVQHAAHAIQHGELERVLAEARAKLEADLDQLHGVIHDATQAPAEWLDARHAEHAELTEEVRTKLDRVERIRRALGMLLPHLQTLVRGLTVAERVEAVESHRNELLNAVGTVWDAAIPSSSRAHAPARPQLNRRWVLAAAAVVAAIVIALVLALAGGGKKKPAAAAAATTTVATTTSAPTTTAAAVPPAPKLSAVHAVFVEAQRETTYAISATGSNVSYAWQLTPPKDNPTCNKFAQVPGKPNEAVWHHSSTDGCTHNGFQHLGLVTVTVSTPDWQCVATFFGTLTHSGPPPQRCHRV